MKDGNLFSTLLTTCQFYASMILGFLLYSNYVFPYITFTDVYKDDVALTVYLLNVLAFGSMLYLASKPFVALFEHLVVRFRKGFDSLDKH